MAETESGQSEAGAAPAEAPANPTAEEIRAMVQAEAQAIVDARIPGLQSAYERQIASKQKEIDRLKSDPDGYASGQNSQLEAELAQARREAEGLRAGRQYPDAYPVFEAIMSASTAEEQLEALQQALRPQAPPAPEAPQATAPETPAAPAPPVDLNRPLGGVPAGRIGETMDQATADAIIDAMSAWPDTSV